MNNNVLLAVVAVIILIIGFAIYGVMSGETDMDTDTINSPTSAEIEAQLEREAEFREQREAEEAEAQEVAFTIEVANLPEEQRASLQAMGITDTSLQITNGMLECARVDMSETRVNEIMSGATTTASEGMKLVSCYNAN